MHTKKNHTVDGVLHELVKSYYEQDIADHDAGDDGENNIYPKMPDISSDALNVIDK